MKEKLLIPEPPLQTLPTLALKFGIKEAMILQQLHYRLLISPYKIDGYTWYRHTYANWQRQFPFYSEKTISRAFLNLEKEGIIISSQQYNPAKVMKTKWYRINYEELYRLLGIQYDSISQTVVNFSSRMEESTHYLHDDYEEVDLHSNNTTEELTVLGSQLDDPNISPNVQSTIQPVSPHAMKSQNDSSKHTKESPATSQFAFPMEDKEVASLKEEFKEERNNTPLVEKLDIVAEVIHYLNSKTNRNYRVNNHATRRFINARLKEGYQLEDFKKVIDWKVNQWLHDPKMKTYLRPNTLFNPTNFENYLVESKEAQVKPMNREIKPVVLDFNLGEED